MFSFILGCIIWLTCMVLFYTGLHLLVAAAVKLTKPEVLKRKLDKQDERRYMPKEMLIKP